MLETHGLTKAFGALAAVDQIDLEVPRGQLTSIIGPNGAGKSTLFNLISGQLQPDQGEIRFEGEPITGRPPYELLKKGIARSFQITNLFGGLTVAENLRLAAQAKTPRRWFLTSLDRLEKPLKIAAELLDRFELAHLAAEEARHLSHGDQRRLEIAVCMASRPKLLMLDEPTQGMAREETKKTDELIRKLVGAVTVLLIEHDIELVMSISDKVVVMHQGRKIAEGAPETVRRNPEVQDAYLGRMSDDA
jgi:ABC-type branched-chain amino acid transport systems, ATPase component